MRNNCHCDWPFVRMQTCTNKQRHTPDQSGSVGLAVDRVERVEENGVVNDYAPETEYLVVEGCRGG